MRSASSASCVSRIEWRNHRESTVTEPPGLVTLAITFCHDETALSWVVLAGARRHRLPRSPALHCGLPSSLRQAVDAAGVRVTRTVRYLGGIFESYRWSNLVNHLYMLMFSCCRESGR